MQLADKHGGRFYDVAKVSAYLFEPETIFAADLAIVFGMNAWRRPLGRALDLYKNGHVRKLLFTGGFNQKIQAVEATEMALGALEAGVAGDDVLIEPKAANSAENIRFSLDRVERSLGADNVRSIILVAIEFHMRRVRLVTEQIWPAPVRVGWATYPSAFYSRTDWQMSERGRHDVAAELSKIQRYHGTDLSFLVRGDETCRFR